MFSKTSRKLIGFIKKSRARILDFDANNEMPRFCSEVSAFKELTISGPYYKCVGGLI